MKQEKYLKNKGFWLAKIQVGLFQEIEKFKRENSMNNTQLAEFLGCSKSYISQLLNGDFDHRISKLVELSLAIGRIPVVSYRDLKEYVRLEEIRVRRSNREIKSQFPTGKNKYEYSDKCTKIISGYEYNIS